MKRTIFICMALFAVSGCPQKQSNDQERLAQMQTQLEAAEKRKSFWQTTATVLGVLTLLSLIIGAALGSRAKEDSLEK